VTTVTDSSPIASVRRRERPEPANRQVERRAADGFVLGTVDLDPHWFGAEPNVPLMHQVVVAQLAAARSGTQSTKTRAEVAGGGAKPFRQKGMGRSRQGSIRAPQWVGGGIAFGPKPRSYRQRTPKKMIHLALCSALADRAALDRVVLVSAWPFELPKTKLAVAALDALGVSGRILVVTGADDVVAERSFGNLPRVQIMQATELNTYDVLRSDWVIFTDETLPGGVGDVSSHDTHTAELVIAPKAPKKAAPVIADEDDDADDVEAVADVTGATDSADADAGTDDEAEAVADTDADYADDEATEDETDIEAEGEAAAEEEVDDDEEGDE
jgi:large subunit ribosomal protein L4